MLIFSDVDGTLLDDDGRCPLPDTVLREVAPKHRVVLASSRDAGELREVQAQLGWDGPCIAEDGAVLVHDGTPEVLGQARAQLLTALRAALPSGEWGHLLAGEPAAAHRRLASILLPRATVTAMHRRRLEVAGLTVMPGGRWTTITVGASKGDAARVLGHRLGVPRWAAIGNAPNDATLIQHARPAFVVRNPDGHDPVLARIAGVTLLNAPGPAGWLEMLTLLDQRTGDMPGKERHDDDSAVDHQHPDDPGT